MKITVESKSRLEVEDDCRKWAREIYSDFRPDLIVFVANSGFLFGKAIADELDLNLEYVKAVRSGNKAKNTFNKFGSIIPKGIVKCIISSPIKFWVHAKKNSRNVIIPDELSNKIKDGNYNILLVDDAVDTGWTIKQVIDTLYHRFEKVVIKTAAYTVSGYSSSVIKIDYYRNWNNLILTATSRNSKEYFKYLRDLEEWLVNHKE